MTYFDPDSTGPAPLPTRGGNRRNAATIAAAQRDNAHITAIGMFGELHDMDPEERALIQAIIAAASECGNAPIYQMATRLLRLQDREDPIHELGFNAVRAAWTKETAPGVATA